MLLDLTTQIGFEMLTIFLVLEASLCLLIATFLNDVPEFELRYDSDDGENDDDGLFNFDATRDWVRVRVQWEETGIQTPIVNPELL